MSNSWVLSNIFQGSLEKWLRQGKIRDGPGILCSAKEKCSRKYGDMSKVLRRKCEGAPKGRMWNHQSKKIRNYNPQNKNGVPRLYTDVTFLNE